jgi:hypothetical protein
MLVVLMMSQKIPDVTGPTKRLPQKSKKSTTLLFIDNVLVISVMFSRFSFVLLLFRICFWQAVPYHVGVCFFFHSHVLLTLVYGQHLVLGRFGVGVRQ